MAPAPHQTSLLGFGDPVLTADATIERTALDDHSWVDLARVWMRGSDTLLAELAEKVLWGRGRRWMYDRMVDDPRLSRWYRRAEPLPHEVLADAQATLEAHYRVPLRGPALNYYRDGHDSVAPHADRELRKLDDTLVAILTLGPRAHSSSARVAVARHATWRPAPEICS